MHEYIQTYIHTYIHRTYIHPHIYIHTHIHIYMRTYIHTYIVHTHTYLVRITLVYIMVSTFIVEPFPRFTMRSINTVDLDPPCRNVTALCCCCSDGPQLYCTSPQMQKKMEPGSVYCDENTLSLV